MTSPVIDLSHHNADPDFVKVAASGVIGVIHKATENISYQDPNLYPRMAAAQQAGLLTSTYHFLRPGNIAQQMEFYLSVIDPVQGERVVLDYEDDGLRLDELMLAVNILWQKRPDLQITIYSGHLIKEQLGNTRNQTLAKTSLWIAQYTSAKTPSWPSATWPQWSLWQWTDVEKVPGIYGLVDGNRWNGSPDALVAWMSPAGSKPAPQPAPAPAPEPAEEPIIEMAISGEVKLIINGRYIDYD